MCCTRLVELLFLFLTVEALQGKMCQNSLPSGGVGHLEPIRFQGEEVVPGEYFLVSTKLYTFCYLTVQTAVVLTQYRRVSDGRTDGQTELPELTQCLQCEHCVRCNKRKNSHKILNIITDCVSKSSSSIHHNYCMCPQQS